MMTVATATVAKSGSLTLPAKKLYEIVKALPETDVRIEEDKGGVKVAADGRPLHVDHGPGATVPVDPLRAAGRRTVQLWELPDTGHTAGLRTHPAAYERRTVGFLDRALGVG